MLLGVHAGLIASGQTTFEYLTAVHRREHDEPGGSPGAGESDAEDSTLWSPSRVNAVEERVSFTARLGVDDPYYNVPQASRPPWYTSRGSVSEVLESGLFGDSIDALIIGTPTFSGELAGSFGGENSTRSNRNSGSIHTMTSPRTPPYSQNNSATSSHTTDPGVFDPI